MATKKKTRKKSDTFLDKVGDAYRNAAKSGVLGTKAKISATEERQPLGRTRKKTRRKSR